MNNIYTNSIHKETVPHIPPLSYPHLFKFVKRIKLRDTVSVILDINWHIREKYIHQADDECPKNNFRFHCKMRHCVKYF